MTVRISPRPFAQSEYTNQAHTCAPIFLKPRLVNIFRSRYIEDDLNESGHTAISVVLDSVGNEIVPQL